MFEQLIYTSCKTGIKKLGTGFQVYSHSVGMNPETVDEIQRHCSYKAPYSLPIRPTKEEIEELFPISFSYKRVNNDKLSCFFRNKYIGQDYMGENGRFGVYITHAIGRELDGINFHPISAIISECFVNDLSREEKASDVCPPLLEKINETDFLPQNADAVMISKTRDFLFNEPDRLENLKGMVDAFVSAQQDKKRIVICDDKENIPYWIAALTLLLPLDHAKRITFDTYVESPQYSDSRIIGVFPDGTCYNPNDLMGSCYIFDLKSGIVHGSAQSYLYSEMVCDAFTLSEDELCEFNCFLSTVAGKAEIDKSVDDYLRLFDFCKGKGTYTNESLLSIIETTYSLGNKNVEKAVFEVLNSNIDDWCDGLSCNTANSIIEFVYGYEKENADGIFAVSRNVFEAIISSLVFNNDDAEYEAVVLLYSNYVEVLYGEEIGFLTELFEASFGERVIKLFEGNNGFLPVDFFADKLFKYLVVGKYTFDVASQKSGLVKVIINNILDTYKKGDNIFCHAIELADGDTEYSVYLMETFISLIKVSPIADKNYAVEEVARKYLSFNTSVDKIVSVIGLVNEQECFAVAKEIAKETVGKYGVEFLEKVLEADFMHDFVENNMEMLIDVYLSKKAPSVDELIDFVISFKDIPSMKAGVLKAYDAIERDICIELPLKYDKDKLKELLKAKKELGITVIGRFDALVAVLQLKKAVESSDGEELWDAVKRIASSKQLEKTNDSEIKKLAEIFIPLLCNKASSEQEQDTIVVLFACAGIPAVIKLLTENAIAGYESLGTMVLVDNFYIVCKYEKGGIDCAESMEILSYTISKLPKEKFESIGTQASMAYADNAELKQKWDEMYLPVLNKRNSSLGNKIFGIFKSGKKNKNENENTRD